MVQVPENSADRNRLLTVAEVAEYLRVHPNTVRQWSNNGILKAVRIGNRRDRRFQINDIIQFLSNGNGPEL